MGSLTPLNHVFRRWIRRPLFAATSVVVLGLGIGATISTYSLLDAVFFRPPPWPQPNRLAIVHAVRLDQRNVPAFAATWNRAPIAWASWRDLQRSAAFTDVGAWTSSQQIFGLDRAEFVQVFYASSSFFSVLGVSPAAGRLFVPDDDETMGDAVIISHETWQRRFGGRSDIIGQTTALTYTMRSQTERKTIVGVLPAGFRFQGQAPDLFLPMGLMAFNGTFDENQFLRVVARLRPNVSLTQANAVAEPLVRRSALPETRTSRVITLAEDEFGAVTRPLWLLLASSGLLLVIACSSVAGLLLVDGSARRDEMAVRVSLGGTRAQLMQQLLIEYVILAIAAGVAGALIARWFTPVLVVLAPAVMSHVELATSLECTVWAIALSLVTVLLFGLSPALRLSATPARSTLAASAGTNGHRVLVAGQLGTAFVLVVAGGLFGETLLRLRSDSQDFDPHNLAVVTVRPKSAPIATASSASGSAGAAPASQVARLYSSDWLHTDAILQRLAGIPGVLAVAGASVAPFTRTPPSAAIVEVGGPGDEHDVQRRDVTEDYFRVMGIPVLAGRTFLASDRDYGLPYWAVVSQELARHLTGGVAVGKKLTWRGSPLEIIGVVDDVRQQKASRSESPALYLLNFRAEQVNYLLVRASGDMPGLLPTIRRSIAEFDSTLQVTASATMADLISESLRDERFAAFMSGALGGTSLLLAAVGLFGLTNYLVARRRREVAVRIVLGATVSDIRWLVLRDAGIILGLGLISGVPIAFGVSRIARSLLFGVPTVPVGVFAFGFLALAAVATVAISSPVLRVGHVNVVETLRD